MPTYTTSAKVADLLLTDNFTSTSTPTNTQVDALISRTEGLIDRVTKRSWKTNSVTDEEHEFNYAGIKLKHAPVAAISEAAVWQGSSYDVLTQGRDQEFFFVKDTGMIYFTRFFIPVFVPPTAEAPAVSLVFLYSWRYPIKVSYTWGETFSTHADAPLVEDIATKLAATDILNIHERTVITKMGVDRQQIREKIELWRKDADEGMKVLARGFEVW